MAIHRTAVVAPGAVLAEGVEIGPYAVIGAQVRIGAGTVVGAHAVIEGRTTIGERNRIFQFAALGAIPQDLKYQGEPTELVIGDDNQIREFTTLHIGTAGGGGVTSIGNRNLFMNFSHVAHDCHIGERVICANGATLAGHVTVEDYVIVGGLAAVHQFVRLGESSMLGGGAMVVQDVPPFCVVQGDRAGLVGLNVEGMRRRGFADDDVRGLRGAYRTLFRSGLTAKEAVRKVREEPLGGPVERLVQFVENSKRGICRLRGEAGD
ncbi:MAG TPA: acyl-ACP--UDP-N-acetylglucosamine O-acyltransferase, partial [Candidatus Binatia bacterium]|nr:acyl-ACP--UDP-N-acetylglucosamine O-acyltransferase [Candidatus Binatia bacterium]